MELFVCAHAHSHNILVRCYAVSYTHLDVYKRQLLGKLTPVAWVAGMTLRRSSASDNSKLPEELQELLNRSSNELSSGEIKELRQFLHEFIDCYAFLGQSLGRTSLVQHRINTCLLYTSVP